MQVESSAQPFFISKERLEYWDKRPHQHNFFELVYIVEGSGSQCINNSHIPYGKGNVFLLPPYDCHSFKLSEPTEFIFVRWNSLFFRKDSQQMMDYTEWFQNLHYILSSYNRRPGDIVRGPDKVMLVNLIEGIYEEYMGRRSHADSIIRAHMFALLNILVRNFEQQFRDDSMTPDRQVNDMLQYIQYNLFDNEKLKVESLASVFHLAPTYVSEFFKKKTGQTLKEYILRSRVNVAKSRLENSDQSAKEIAYELGFTDASHMTKVIRKYYPSETGCSVDE